MKTKKRNEIREEKNLTTKFLSSLILNWFCNAALDEAPVDGGNDDAGDNGTVNDSGAADDDDATATAAAADNDDGDGDDDNGDDDDDGSGGSCDCCSDGVDKITVEFSKLRLFKAYVEQCS